MSPQISNIMSLDDHVIKINLAKNKVKISIFEMAEVITNAVNQLENRQTELASKLGMSKGTLSKWLSIGVCLCNLNRFPDPLPMVTSTKSLTRNLST